LLRVLANLAAPDAGDVRYDGKLAAELGGRALARRLSFLAQDGQAQWPLRAEALVALGRLPHRKTFQGLGADDHAAIERALALADVAHLRERTVGRVSGGERMRILLARALAVEAEILLADEPIAALDPAHQLQIMGLLRGIAHEGRGVVAVLHDLSLAARYCDRLVLLSRGRVLADGPPCEVLTDARLAEAYGIEVVRGERAGVPFLVPWAAVGARSDVPPDP
jgi:iron complex transport system ATP-binding protein